MPTATPIRRSIARNFSVTPSTGVQSGTNLTMEFLGLKGTSTRVTVGLTNHASTITYLCPTLRFSMPSTGTATITATMPSEVSYFKRLVFIATMTNWGASQWASTSGTISNPATSSKAATVCGAFSRSIQRFQATARAAARSQRRLSGR
jgi:hypothetical protein